MKKEKNDRSKNSIMEFLYQKFIQEWKRTFVNGNSGDEKNENDKKKEYILWQQIEKAHWHYLDYVQSLRTEENEKDGSINNALLLSFVIRMGRQHAWLRNILSIDNEKDLEKQRREYKRWQWNVPVYGCILLDETMEHVLLVRGTHERSYWTFPRGKLDPTKEQSNDDKTNGVSCAVREVWEEIGFNVSDRIDKNKAITVSFKGQEVTLYIIDGINKEKTRFFIHSKEIGEYVWFSVQTLCMESLLLDPIQYRFVLPFAEHIRKVKFHHDCCDTTKIGTKFNEK